MSIIYELQKNIWLIVYTRSPFSYVFHFGEAKGRFELYHCVIFLIQLTAVINSSPERVEQDDV